MKKIKLFLASSFDGLEKDRKELGAFIGDLNERYEPYGAYFQLIMSDDDAKSDFVHEAADCDLFYIIFHKEAHSQALDEFNAAYKSFLNGKRPRITTYFKKIENDEPDQSVLAFMERLDKEIGHYYNNYAHIDTVKLNFVLQLKSLGLDKVRMELKDSSLCVDDKPIMALDNIPLVFNNKQLAELKNDRAKIEKEFWELRDKTRQNPDDDNAFEAFIHVKEKKKQADEAIHNLQKAIIDMETSFLEKTGFGDITPRQKFARKCLEDGDIEGAKQALDADELKRDGVRALELLDSQKKELQALVSDWEHRAHVLHMDWNNPNREAEVCEAYEQAIDIERKGGLARNTLFKYSWYLFLWGQPERAVEYAEEYLHYLKGNQYGNADYLPVYSYLAGLYRGLKRYDESEEMYRQELDVLKQLALEDPEKYVEDLKISFISLEGLMFCRDRSDEIEELSKQKLDVLKQLAKEHPKNLDCAALLAEFYVGQGLLIEDKANYDEAGRPIIWDESEPYRNDEAKKLYRQAIDIWERLAQENPIKYEGDLATSYVRLSALVEEEEEEKLLTQVLNIRLRQTSKSLTEFGADLSRAYDYLAHFLEKRSRYDEAGELYKKSLDIIKQLANENPKEYEGNLITSCKSMARFMEKRNRYCEAEELYIQSLDITKRLAAEDPKDCSRIIGVAEIYIELADLQQKESGYDAAEKLYRQAIDILTRLETEIIYDPQNALCTEISICLEDAYGKLARLMEDRKRYDEAEGLYKLALKINYRHAVDEISGYGMYGFVDGFMQACNEFKLFLEKTGKIGTIDLKNQDDVISLLKMMDLPEENLEAWAIDFSMYNLKKDPEFLKTVEELKPIIFSDDDDLDF